MNSVTAPKAHQKCDLLSKPQTYSKPTIELVFQEKLTQWKYNQQAAEIQYIIYIAPNYLGFKFCSPMVSQQSSVSGRRLCFLCSQKLGHFLTSRQFDRNHPNTIDSRSQTYFLCCSQGFLHTHQYLCTSHWCYFAFNNYHIGWEIINALKPPAAWFSENYFDKTPI